MATQTAIALEEYLKTTWEHDREYVRGEVVERGMPTFFHAWMQIRLGVLLSRLAEHDLWAGSEGRSFVAADIVRLPDIAVRRGRRPVQRISDEPPVIAIEILSPDDRLADVLAKFREYQGWGVPHIWLIDPESRDMFVFVSQGLIVVSEFALPEFGVTYTARDIFDE